MSGKLLVLEGTDASGKSTQFERLCQALDARGIEYRRLVFPRYKEESSALIRMYLGGQFGTHPDDVSAYTASTFFAVDRYASYQTEWKDYYENGGLILADRYTTSNAVHQASKLEGDEQKAFLDWLFDFEYHLLGLPEPSLFGYAYRSCQESVGAPEGKNTGYPRKRSRLLEAVLSNGFSTRRAVWLAPHSVYRRQNHSHN